MRICCVFSAYAYNYKVLLKQASDNGNFNFLFINNFICSDNIKVIFLNIKIFHFEVRVTNVSLWIRNSVQANSLNLTAGISETFTCTTSVSRPLPTIIWYIGRTEQKRVVGTESNFAFIPKITDNGQQVYCKAFNIQPESEALLSDKVVLNVKGKSNLKLANILLLYCIMSLRS
jgi:hypothetical protein